MYAARPATLKTGHVCFKNVTTPISRRFKPAADVTTIAFWQETPYRTDKGRTREKHAAATLVLHSRKRLLALLYSILLRHVSFTLLCLVIAFLSHETVVVVSERRIYSSETAFWHDLQSIVATFMIAPTLLLSLL